MTKAVGMQEPLELSHFLRNGETGSVVFSLARQTAAKRANMIDEGREMSGRLGLISTGGRSKVRTTEAVKASDDGLKNRLPLSAAAEERFSSRMKVESLANIRGKAVILFSYPR